MEMKLNVVYEIKDPDSYRNKKGLNIKSNIADDELVDCQIAKSLVDHLKKESAILEPDKLILGFAEAQKRGIQENLESLDDLELNAQNKSKTIHEKMIKLFDDSETKFEELDKKFSETQRRFDGKIESTRKSLEKNMEYLNSVSEKLSNVDSYSLERLSDTLKKIIELVEKDSKIVSLVLNHKKANKQ